MFTSFSNLSFFSVEVVSSELMSAGQSNDSQRNTSLVTTNSKSSETVNDSVKNVGAEEYDKVLLFCNTLLNPLMNQFINIFSVPRTGVIIYVHSLTVQCR